MPLAGEELKAFRDEENRKRRLEQEEEEQRRHAAAMEKEQVRREMPGQLLQRLGSILDCRRHMIRITGFWIVCAGCTAVVLAYFCG